MQLEMELKAKQMKRVPSGQKMTCNKKFLPIKMSFSFFYINQFLRNKLKRH